MAGSRQPERGAAADVLQGKVFRSPSRFLLRPSVRPFTPRPTSCNLEVARREEHDATSDHFRITIGDRSKAFSMRSGFFLRPSIHSNQSASVSGRGRQMRRIEVFLVLILATRHHHRLCDRTRRREEKFESFPHSRAGGTVRF